MGFRVWLSVLGLGFWYVTQGFEFRVLGFCSGLRVFGSGVGFWGFAKLLLRVASNCFWGSFRVWGLA